MSKAVKRGVMVQPPEYRRGWQVVAIQVAYRHVERWGFNESNECAGFIENMMEWRR
jgi:hypothetical protein